MCIFIIEFHDIKGVSCRFLFHVCIFSGTSVETQDYIFMVSVVFFLVRKSKSKDVVDHYNMEAHNKRKFGQ